MLPHLLLQEKNVGGVILLLRMTMSQQSQSRSDRADTAERWADKQITPAGR